MSSNEKNSVDNQDNKPETAKTSNRRRFIKQGVMVAPIITTVASQPAWGRGVISISGNLSGNMSRTPDTYTKTTYDGLSPGYWKFNNENKDPSNRFDQHATDLVDPNTSAQITKDTKFCDIFTFSDDTSTIFEILWLQGHDDKKVEKFAIVAYLNALKDGVSFPYTPLEIQTFVNSYIDPRLAGVPRKRRISHDLAKHILENLIHNGTGETVPEEDTGENPFDTPAETYDPTIHNCTKWHPHKSGVCNVWEDKP